MIQVKKKTVLTKITLAVRFNLLISLAISTFLLILLNANNCFAINSFEEIKNYLINKTNLENNDLSQLENGKMVSKLLAVDNKKEVAVFGVIPINTQPDLAFQAFQESLIRQSSKSSNDFGSFSNPPTPEDVQNLTLEDRDIEDLKKCEIGNCNVKLSAEMIERFQKEIDWNAPDYAKQATKLYRQMILDYVRDYLLRGDAALIKYDDKKDTVNLADENSSLLNESILVNDFAPDFAKYIKDFPHSELPNITQSITWAKVKFGLKPVIIVTQTINYRMENAGSPPQIFSVTKQIYANHYFESSLGLAAVIKAQDNKDDSKSYLLYSNYSRSDALGGTLGKLARKTVETQAVDKLETLLQTARYISESKSADPDESTSFSGQPDLIKNYSFWLLSMLVIAALLFWFALRKTSKKGVLKTNKSA